MALDKIDLCKWVGGLLGLEAMLALAIVFLATPSCIWRVLHRSRTTSKHAQRGTSLERELMQPVQPHGHYVDRRHHPIPGWYNPHRIGIPSLLARHQPYCVRCLSWLGRQAHC